jgi:hypothetical protein
MVDLMAEPPGYLVGIFRIYLTVDAETTDVRPSVRGEPYGDFRLAPGEPVDNPQPTAYDRVDDRIFWDVFRSRLGGPQPEKR